MVAEFAGCDGLFDETVNVVDPSTEGVVVVNRGLEGIAVLFGLALDRFRNVKWWLSAASYCVRFGAGPLALLLYGVDLWWTGHAPDRAGGVRSSLITGFLIAVSAGAATTKHRSKDTTGGQ